jgi:hypothetical protein
MGNIFLLIFCIVLCLIVFYDFKYRALPICLLIVAIILSILMSVTQNGVNVTLRNSSLNIIIIGFQLGLTTLYISVKSGNITSIFDSWLGFGDVVFFMVISFSFSPLNFILFIIYSGLITLGFCSIFKEKIIPLAGFQAGILCMILLVSKFFNGIQPYDDFFLINLLIS